MQPQASLTIKTAPRSGAKLFREALLRQTGILITRNYFAGNDQLATERCETPRMDMTWITARIALGGGIWNQENMAAVARTSVTHIIDMQIEFDDTPLAEPHGIQVLWNPTDDDFQSKPPELFQRGVDFALNALEDDGARVFVHCAAGVHRAAMMTLAILCAEGWDMQDAMQTIMARRPVVDFADVYVESVERFLQQQVKAAD
jgi:protein-tyrosine phosphatase